MDWMRPWWMKVLMSFPAHLAGSRSVSGLWMEAVSAWRCGASAPSAQHHADLHVHQQGHYEGHVKGGDRRVDNESRVGKTAVSPLPTVWCERENTRVNLLQDEIHPRGVCFFIRFVEMCLCITAVNGCRQNESLIRTAQHSSPSVNIWRRNKSSIKMIIIQIQ